MRARCACALETTSVCGIPDGQPLIVVADDTGRVPEAVDVGSVNWRKRGARYQVSWRLDDGSQGSQTVGTREQAVTLAAEKRMEIASGAWKGRQRGKLAFDRWANDWWAVWSTEPTLSPNSLTMTDSRLHNHLRPFFGRRPIEDVTPRLLRQWQNDLATRLGYATVMACRSVLFRILQFAEDENAIPANPMRKVPAPKRPVDPDVVLGTAKRRVLTPEEAGMFLAAFPRFWWDHIITLLGCGLRISELAGLRRGRVDLDRGVLQVVDTRYQTGRKYGSGFKGPKTAAGVREIPLARQVAEAIARRLPPGHDQGALVFTGPGGGPGRSGSAGVPRGARTVLSRDNFRRLYMRAVARTADPAASLSPTGRYVLGALRAGEGQTVGELVERLAAAGRRLRLVTVAAWLTHLEAAGLIVAKGSEHAPRWSAVAPDPGPLRHLHLSGPHDLRHTFATWLEDAAVPARVIDELMGHAGGRPAERGSTVGRVYRHTTPEMLARVVGAIEERLAVVLRVADGCTGRR
jgi:integrase